MTNNLPPSASAYAPPFGYQRTVNSLADVIYCAAIDAPRKIRKATARYLEGLGLELADSGADNETVATLLELAARLRHTRAAA